MEASISRIKLFKSCRRAYELRYLENLEPVTVSDALETGQSYHGKLEELYRTGSFDASDHSKASAMAKAYEKHVYPRFKLKAVEEWFSLALCPEHSIVGRVDGVTTDGLLVEHKTTSSDLEPYEYDLEWDEQIPCYMLAYGVDRMIYTVIKKPTIRIKKNEIEEEFYQRMIDWYDDDTEQKIKCIVITRTAEQLANFRRELIRMCDEMERAEAFKLMYKNPAYCHRWGTLCEYAQICNDYDPNNTYVNFRKRGTNGYSENDTDTQW